MYYLSLLVVLIVFILPIVAIILALNTNGRVRLMENRILTLEKELERINAKKGAKKESATAQTTSEKTLKQTSPKVEVERENADKKPEIAAEKTPVLMKVKAVEKVQDSADEPPKKFVFTDENKARLKAFIQEYWLYILGALTLTLSGVYLVRWGIENGFVPPIMRVLFAALLGGGLIYLAERFLQKWGDEKGSAMEYLPSSMAAAGVSILYATVFGAHSLYGLISGNTALLGLVIIAIIAIVAGMRFGLLLSALGVIGAYLSPFLVGGDSEAQYMLFGYSLLIMVVALIVDSFRRSAWLSTLGMLASMAFSIFVYTHANWIYAYNLGLTIYGFGFLLAAVIIPERRLVPQMRGADMLDWILHRKRKRFPEFPTRVANLGMFGAVVVALTAYLSSWQSFFWLDIWYFFIITLLAFLWLGRSEALQDLALIPMMAGVLVLVVFEPELLLQSPELRQKFIVIVLMAVVLGLLSALASFYFKRHRQIYGYVAIAYPLVVAAVLQVFWAYLPLSAYSKWLGVLLFGEALLIAFIYFQKLGRASMLTEIAVIACFAHVSLIGFRILPAEQWVFLNLALMALALYLSVYFSWKYLGRVSRIFTFFAAFLAMRKTVWIFTNTDLILSIWMPIGVCVAFYGALYFSRQNKDEKLVAQYEGYLFALVPVIIITIARYVADYFNIDLDYLRVAWASLIFFAMAFGMRRRAKISDHLNPVRRWAMGVYLVIACGLGLVAAVALNPFFRANEPVLGWPILNSLLLAYAPLCAVIYFVWKKVDFPDKEKFRLNWVFYGAVSLLLLELNRQIWQGSIIYYGRANSMAETVSYTVMLLLATGFAMYKTLEDRSKIWRNIALALLIVTAIKVYFIDLTHTAGIARVLVLFIFGAVLLGFNFVNRKIFANNAQETNEISNSFES